MDGIFNGILMDRRMYQKFTFTFEDPALIASVCLPKEKFDGKRFNIELLFRGLNSIVIWDGTILV